jgi:hypothetical protein
MSQSEETVIIGKCRSKAVYHTDEDCPSVQGLTSRREVDKSRYPNYSLCSWCDDEKVNVGGVEEQDYKPCPFCGEEVFSIAKHLPCSES